MEIIDFGLKDYEETLKLQQCLFEELLDNKKKDIPGKEYLLIGEHPDVITVGRRGKGTNILASQSFLEAKGIKVFNIGRGGDVTFHNPGQVILYPIIDLEKHHLGVKDYVSLLEESVIQVLLEFGIKGERVEGATGVWIDKETESERKISAIGVKCSRWCTMHGLSLNVCNDLKGFNLINPCGFQDKGVTSMNREGANVDTMTIKKRLLEVFLNQLTYLLQPDILSPKSF